MLTGKMGTRRVEEQLRAEIKAIETLLETNGLPRKKDTLDKVQKQLADISALVAGQTHLAYPVKTWKR